MVTKKHLEALNSRQSWRSPAAVIAHIDLDAFYAQCLGVHGGFDPSEPLGCRQWNSLIAVNYPARNYGVKRGVSCDEAQRLCPDIHLPHVATFKKGEQEWAFHEKPDPNNYKVSLDYFRRESRRIFEVFKEHFSRVEKAGIDEAFVDLGPEVYKAVLAKHSCDLTNIGEDDECGVTHDELVDQGAELVHAVRLEIHERLRYTCSAGISVTKQVAKLASAFKKPFNQTTVHKQDVEPFLANFKLTDVWGWGGKTGQHALAQLGIDPESDDQCEVLRAFSLESLQQQLDYQTAVALHSTVRGEYVSEVRPRTLMKSMNAVKDFRKLQFLESMDDVRAWIEVFSADLAGRLQDVRDDLDAAVVPKTLTMKQFTDGFQSRQKPFSVRGTSVKELQLQIRQQATELAAEFIALPCVFLTVEITGLHELPKEQIAFTAAADEEELFVDEYKQCDKCGRKVPLADVFEHDDWHFAKSLAGAQAVQAAQAVSTTARETVPAKAPNARSAKRKAPASPARKKAKAVSKNQRSILDFMGK